MERLASSYRDPAGFVFKHNEKIYRFIQPGYFENYELLFQSGLYVSLVNAKRLVPHEEISDAALLSRFDSKGKIILPAQISFISYPYEWAFDMWRDAALVTLKVALDALAHGMILKDATPFNIQFSGGRPVFIDTLSFEKYPEGRPWVAYRQFTECFLGPLLLMHYLHRDMGKMFLTYPEGIPLDVIKQMLQVRAKWNLHAYMHIWLQQKISVRPAQGTGEKDFSKQKLVNLLNGLQLMIEKLKPKKAASEWGNYYTETISGDGYLQEKTKLVENFANEVVFETVIDLGSNDGFFSALLSSKAKQVIAVDGDSVCVNAMYRQIRKEKITNIIPLVGALNNPSPAIGWCNKERNDLTTRLRADLVLALAVVHHLAITNNIPLSDIADGLRNMAKNLIIEFVPREDEKVKILLTNRETAFPEYTVENFINAFTEKFEILKQEKISPTHRVLFLMKARR